MKSNEADSRYELAEEIGGVSSGNDAEKILREFLKRKKKARLERMPAPHNGGSVVSPPSPKKTHTYEQQECI